MEALSANLEDEREKNACLKKDKNDFNIAAEIMRVELHSRDESLKESVQTVYFLQHSKIMLETRVVNLKRANEQYQRICNELTHKNQELEQENAKYLLAASDNITVVTDQVDEDKKGV